MEGIPSTSFEVSGSAACDGIQGVRLRRMPTAYSAGQVLRADGQRGCRTRATCWESAAMARYEHGPKGARRHAAAEPQRFCLLTIGSGTGNKVFHGGEILLDADGHGGELGHWVCDASPGAPLCDRGASGHLGAITSGRGVLAAARRAAVADCAGFARSRLAALSDGPRGGSRHPGAGRGRTRGRRVRHRDTARHPRPSRAGEYGRLRLALQRPPARPPGHPPAPGPRRTRGRPSPGGRVHEGSAATDTTVHTARPAPGTASSAGTGPGGAPSPKGRPPSSSRWCGASQPDRSGPSGTMRLGLMSVCTW